MRLALLLALVACGRAETSAPRLEPGPPVATTVAPIPADAEHLITGVVADWTATDATLRHYRRDHGRWVRVGEPWPAVIGRTGAAWGVGLHGSGAPAGHAGPLKHEGDGKSPAGVFALRGSYGYAAAPPAGSTLPYHQAVATTECVDDPASRHYNSIVTRDAGADWKSAEQMRRPDELYTWVIDIAHNPAATPGAGSCIFFHVWHGAGSTTVGCTAMDEPRLADLLASLDPHAVYVLLPAAEYEALATAWQLPPQ